MNSCLIIAGEKSGEEHALTFFPELKKLCPNVSFFGVGGDDLQKMDVELLYHLKDFSSMGFSEVIQKIPFYFKALKKIENEVLRRGAKTAILIDFQDFNLRLAKKLQKRGVRVLYYVAPQAWVWKEFRTKVLATTVDTLFTILPFEKEWFFKRGVKQVKSIPHPLMRTYGADLASVPDKIFGSWGKKIKLLILPGSRKFEVYSLLPEFMRTVDLLRDYFQLPLEVHLVKVGHISSDFYDLYKDKIDILYESEELVKAMKEAHFSLAASGTVTLSTGLFEIPTVVCYKSSLLNEFIFQNFIRYQGPISLTNIIHNHFIFPELIQSAVEPQILARIIWAWSTDEKLYNEIKIKLKETKHLLSGDQFSIPNYMAGLINE